jgi:hypothetical protein
MLSRACSRKKLEWEPQLQLVPCKRITFAALADTALKHSGRIAMLLNK